MITLNPPAKINWSLYVLGKRADGYHDIISLMQCIGLYDTLTLEESEGIELYSDMSIPADRNLVHKAAVALRKDSGTAFGARIHLEKNIPSGAGLGGGSSDAAFTLLGLNELWNLDIGKDRLSRIAAELGSDVPFFLDYHASVVRGRGEILEPARVSGRRHILIVKPGDSIGTAAAYNALDASRVSKSGFADLTNNEEKLNNIKLIIRTLNEGPLHLLGSLLQNDFEPVAAQMQPVTREIKKRLLGQGALAALLSGSGSAVFGLFPDKESAQRASVQLSTFWCRVVETL